MIRTVRATSRTWALAAFIALAALALSLIAPSSARVVQAGEDCDAFDYQSFRPGNYYCAWAKVHMVQADGSTGTTKFSSYKNADGSTRTVQDVTMYLDETLELGGRSTARVDLAGAPKPMVSWGDGSTETASYRADATDDLVYTHYLTTSKHRFQRTGTYTATLSWWFLCCARHDATFSVRVLDRSTPAALAPYDVVLCENDQSAGRCKGYAVSGGNAYADLVADGFNDVASSLRVRAGVKVAVYSDRGGEGTCQDFGGLSLDHVVLALRETSVGNDRASSLWLNHSCSEDVQLCEHQNLTGRCVSFRSDKSHLGYTDIGNDAASSIRVPNGVLVSVYSNSDYWGLIDVFSSRLWRNLGGNDTYVPNDSASSIRVDLRGNYPLPGRMVGQDVGAPTGISGGLR